MTTQPTTLENNPTAQKNEKTPFPPLLLIRQASKTYDNRKLGQDSLGGNSSQYPYMGFFLYAMCHSNAPAKVSGSFGCLRFMRPPSEYGVTGSSPAGAYQFHT